jgi:TRAP transporter 4TM/12TM fusion protein
VDNKKQDIIANIEGSSRYRDVGKIERFIFYFFTCLSIVFAVNYLFGGLLGFNIIYISYYYILMGLLLPMVFFFFPATVKRQRGKIPWYDWIAAILACSIPIYFSTMGEAIWAKGWELYAPGYAVFLGLLLCILVLEAARRVGGISFVIIAFIFFIFPLFAGYAPGIIKGTQLDLAKTISQHVFGPESLLGIPVRVIGELLIGFLILAAVLTRTGAGTFFLNLALAIAGHTRGGGAKVAVIASAFFGSLSGSALSNVASTGCITIPIMRSTGYAAYYAGAVEACASTGGILMPPVMGAVAFVMASLTGIPYSTIIVAAIIPSILYFWGLFIQADGHATKNGLKGVPKEELPSFWTTMRHGWHFLIVLLFLIWGLVYMRWEEIAPFYATALLILLVMLKKETRLDTLRKWYSLIDGVGKLLIEMTALMMPVGLIVGGLIMTGTAPAFTASLVSFAGGSPLIVLLLGGAACFILGMAGMLTPAYIFLAVTLAPAIVGMGMNELAVHLFIIYCCTLSCITPPVAVASFLAAGVAECDPMKTALQSVRLGIVLFFIPYFFVYEPALILNGTALDIIWYFSSALLGIAFLASSIEGYLVGIGRLNKITRCLLGICGLCIFFPDSKLKLVGACIAIIPLGFLLMSKRAQRKVGISRAT